MGVVYEAADRKRGVRIALKTLKTTDAGSILRLKREFRALQELSHPNLVRYHELFESDQRWYIAMELVDGVPLLDYVRRDPDPGVPFNETRLRGAFGQLASAMAYLHRFGKVHRDIKPSNVLVQGNGRVVLLDFGLVADTEGAGQWSINEVVGTAAYLAPEQARSAAVQPCADWYSTGIMLYEALVGDTPFDGTAVEVLLQKQERDVELPTGVPGLPADLVGLCESLARARPERRAGDTQALQILTRTDLDSPALARGSSRTPRRFVGRDDDLNELNACFDQSRRRAVTACVSGESGVGKTSLVGQFVSRLREDAGAIVLAGTCYEAETVPFKAVDALVDALAVYLKGLPALEVGALIPLRASLLADAFPVLKGVDIFCDLPPSRVPEAQEQRQLMFEALADLLRALAQRAPLVLTIDDFQWVDDDSLSLLRQVLQPDNAPPLLLLLTWRSVDGRSEPPALPGDVRSVELDRLSDDDALTLARDGLKRVAPGDLDELALAIARESRGHPLFLDELCRRVSLQRATTTGTGDEDAVVSLEKALWARIQELKPVARMMVELVSVAARPLTLEVISAATGTDKTALERCADELRVLRLARMAQDHGRDAVDTYHSRIRGAVMNQTAPARLAEHHRALARALEQLPNPDAEALSTHWLGAGSAEKAARFAELAGDAAAAALAFDRAARLYRRSINLIEHSPEALRALTIKLGGALANSGHGADAAVAYAAAADGADAGTALDLQWRAAQQWLVTGHHERGIELLDGVLRAQGIRFPRTRGRALASLVWQRARLRASGLRFRTRDESQIPREELARVDLYWYTGSALGPIDPVRGTDFQSRGVKAALAAGEPYRVARALANEASFHALAGPRAARRIDKLLERVRALCDDRPDQHIEALMVTARAVATSCAGDYGAALVWCEKAEAQLRAHCPGSTIEASVMTSFAAAALTMQGQYTELERRLPRWLHDSTVRGHRVTSVSLRTLALASLHLAHDRPDKAIEEARAPLDDWYPLGFSVEHWYELWVSSQALIYAGRAPEALARFDEVAQELGASMLLRTHILNVLAHDLRGRTYLAAALVSDAPQGRLLRAARAQARWLVRQRDTPLAVAMGTALRSSLALAKGDAAQAFLLARDAKERFEELGSALCALVMSRRVVELSGAADASDQLRAVDDQIRALGVARPDKMAFMLAPGRAPRTQ